jgi:formate dehydrogenase
MRASPEPFKDRYYLERDPHRFIEGALIAAWAVGIAEIYIYLRDEYHGCRAILEREIAALEGRSTVSRFHRSICGAAPARTSAVKSPR